MKLHIFQLARAIAKNLQPMLQLSKEGRKAHPQTKAKGILYGITSTGKLRVRMLGTKTIITYPASIWEYAPDQSASVNEMSPVSRAMKKFNASKTLLIPEVPIKKAATAKKSAAVKKLRHVIAANVDRLQRPNTKVLQMKHSKHRRAKRAA